MAGTGRGERIRPGREVHPRAIGHAAGVLSRGRLLLAGVGVVVLAAGAAAGLLRAGVAAPSARIEPDLPH